MQALRAHLRRFVVVPYDEGVADKWAQMHVKLSGHLKGGGANDLWTAACATSLNPHLPIVTNNLSDFLTIAKSFPDVVVVHPDL